MTGVYLHARATDNEALALGPFDLVLSNQVVEQVGVSNKKSKTG